MKEHFLHIIAFNIPYPADYGGVMDIFFKIKSLHTSGIKVILHCFEYNRKRANELNDFCYKVFYYKRKSGIPYLFSTKPYIVITRTSNELLKNLLCDLHPILFEGLHSCNYLNHPALKNRLKIVRTHNIEHHYYKQLARNDSNLLRKVFFSLEAIKLVYYQHQLSYADHLLAISQTDYRYFRRIFAEQPVSSPDVWWVSAFHPYENMMVRAGMGDYALYHGNLSVSENHRAAEFLINEIFAHLKFPLVIAGRCTNDSLKVSASKSKNIKVIPNPTDSELSDLIENAQMNILPAFQDTGIKLKLLVALFKGRHCIVNHKMVDNTGLESTCIITNDTADMIKTITLYSKIPFTIEQIAHRDTVLRKHFFNNFNAKIIEGILENNSKQLPLDN